MHVSSQKGFQMVDFIKTQNTFSNGEVAPEFFAHDNVSGLSKLENMDVLPGGGLSRRCGLSKLADLTKEYRENILLRDNYRSGIKGKRKEARIAALKDFRNLRDSVEAFAVLNTETEVSLFSNLINEAFINVSPNSKKKES